MSNQKVSELSSASAPTAQDLVYLVQPAGSPTSRKITLVDLFAAVPSKGVFTVGINIGTSPETISSADTADLEKVTHVEASNSGWSLIVPAGSEGDIKVIVMDSTGGGTVTLTGTFWNSSIALATAGASVTLLFSGGKWVVIGQSGTASVT